MSQSQAKTCAELLQSPSEIPDPVLYQTKHQPKWKQLPTRLTLSSLIKEFHFHRAKFISSLGVDLVELTTKRNVGFFLQHMKVQNHFYTKSAVADLKSIEFRSKVVAFTHTEKSGTRLKVEIVATDAAGNILATGFADYVTVDTRTGQPLACPPDLWQKFSQQTPLQSTLSPHLFEKFMAPDSTVGEFKWSAKVENGDLDFYRHVSSESYATFFEQGLSELLKPVESFREWEIYFNGSLTALNQPYLVDISRDLNQPQGALIAQLRSEEGQRPLVAAVFRH